MKESKRSLTISRNIFFFLSFFPLTPGPNVYKLENNIFFPSKSTRPVCKHWKFAIKKGYINGKCVFVWDIYVALGVANLMSRRIESLQMAYNITLLLLYILTTKEWEHIKNPFYLDNVKKPFYYLTKDKNKGLWITLQVLESHYWGFHLSNGLLDKGQSWW